MPTSRAIVVLGMHRSGTSAFARGLMALGVYLGDDFLDVRPDNPTGYWENRTIFDLNERLLAALGLTWENVSLVAETSWTTPAVAVIRDEAIAYLRKEFVSHPVWGFKDPRTIRLLPFWRSVFEVLGVDDRYLVAIRNPLSVADSLHRRQYMDAATAHKLWLVYMIPYLDEIAARSCLVADYDCLMDEPRSELQRIAGRLELCADSPRARDVDFFTDKFLAGDLRHSIFGELDFDTIPGVSPLTREAYLWLLRLATDRLAPDSPKFRVAWERIKTALRSLINGGSAA